MFVHIKLCSRCMRKVSMAKNYCPKCGGEAYLTVENCKDDERL